MSNEMGLVGHVVLHDVLGDPFLEEGHEGKSIDITLFDLVELCLGLLKKLVVFLFVTPDGRIPTVPEKPDLILEVGISIGSWPEKLNNYTLVVW